jgi:anti-sigma B factor antagonist
VLIETSDLGNNQLRVILKGRLDTPGVERVETRFVAALVPGGHHGLVDLSQVEFVCSLGVRMFLSVARGLGLKKAQLVLSAPQPQVREVLDHVWIKDLIPICATEEDARALFDA